MDCKVGSKDKVYEIIYKELDCKGVEKILFKMVKVRERRIRSFDFRLSEVYKGEEGLVESFLMWLRIMILCLGNLEYLEDFCNFVWWREVGWLLIRFFVEVLKCLCRGWIV